MSTDASFHVDCRNMSRGHDPLRQSGKTYAQSNSIGLHVISKIVQGLRAESRLDDFMQEFDSPIFDIPSFPKHGGRTLRIPAQFNQEFLEFADGFQPASFGT